jgi:hypothetical protein
LESSEKSIRQRVSYPIRDDLHIEILQTAFFVGLAIGLSIAGSHAAEEAGFQYPRRALQNNSYH